MVDAGPAVVVAAAVVGGGGGGAGGAAGGHPRVQGLSVPVLLLLQRRFFTENTNKVSTSYS